MPRLRSTAVAEPPHRDVEATARPSGVVGEVKHPDRLVLQGLDRPGVVVVDHHAVVRARALQKVSSVVWMMSRVVFSAGRPPIEVGRGEVG